METLARFVAIVGGPPSAASSLADECAREPPVDHAGYRELLRESPQVLQAFRELQPGAREAIGRHLGRSAEGMSHFVARSAESQRLDLETIEDLRDYCYAVAGIVGEMLTELYLLGRPALAGVAENLRNRAAEFGEGLQLVNILKDAGADAAEGRVYLPRQASTREVIALAQRDLAQAASYTETLRAAGAEVGLVAFNAFIAKLAVANLNLLREKGLGAKLSRLQVASIGAEVMRALGQRDRLFAELSSSTAA
jgi:farnesyl-diphosphate farnesyltransferase